MPEERIGPLLDCADDDRCHRCGGRGCEACDYRVLVMLDVGDDDEDA